MTTAQNPAGDASEHEIVITRVFDAPRELVWRAWTEPELVKKWWGPASFTAPVIQIDLRVGGKYLWSMRSDGRMEFWYIGVYREIVPPELIVLTQSMSDEHGNVISDGMPDGMAMEHLLTVTFEERDGKTTMILRHVGMPAGEMAEGAAGGWNESFDKLATALAEA